MKLSRAFSLFEDLWIGITIALFPTLKAIVWNPLLIFNPVKVSRLYLANVWATFGEGVDENGKVVKDTLITPYAYGVVLDLGAGHGHTVRYLNRARVSRYIALEPNSLMHPYIREQANGAGFHEADSTLVILGCGAEETQSILNTIALSDPSSQPSSVPPVDTIVSILTLCSVPKPEKCVPDLVRDVLKPGGQFLMYEHVLSKRADVAWWQRFWAPLWSLGFDGCRLDRPTDILVSDLKVKGQDGKEESVWRESKIWTKEGEDEETLCYHSVGRFVKQ